MDDRETPVSQVRSRHLATRERHGRTRSSCTHPSQREAALARSRFLLRQDMPEHDRVWVFAAADVAFRTRPAVVQAVDASAIGAETARELGHSNLHSAGIVHLADA